MADIKATSFRISEDDIAKFKEFADKEGYNQAEAFKSIMQTVEMAKAKNMIKDRAKEIEVFQDTINNLMSMFLNSLNVNQTSEERIREELSQELQTKDNTISNLYEQLQDIKAEKNRIEEEKKQLNKDVESYEIIGEQLNKTKEEQQKNIDKLNSNIYQKMKGNKVNDLISIGRDRFIELPINIQCVLLLEILNMLTNMKTTYDIKLLGFSTSRTKIALKISNLNEFKIINESITGLYSNEVTIV